ncbi:fatty acyl-AMP ligase [Phenylobacterium deserti]|uniref:fatty acyl-AMP ligase n=1 Tax=Phenylobacterium deserti TaxID=1914756 RepID=UPI001F0BA071|nr:fatty acyl-AMP ligase [Phenylobacterium deserti]
MTITPTSPGRRLRHADFATLTEALDYAATGETGINFHDLRGQLVLSQTYRRLREEAQGLGRAMLAAGLEAGDRVGLVADTTPEFVRAFFACQYAGIIPAPLPLPAPLGGKEAYVAQIGRMLSSAKAAAVFGPAAYDEWVQEAGREAGARLQLSLETLPDGAGRELPAIAPDQTCYLQFSSGSTRHPTGVVVTHRALMANAVAITRDGLQVKPEDRAVSWLPLYHDMGLIGFLLSPLASQMSVDLLPTAAFVRRPNLWLDMISRNGGTISYSPTFGYELCARRGDGGGLDLSKWRIAGVGGDMVRPGPLDAFAETFGGSGFRRSAFVASYGMAEATLALTMAPLEGGLRTETVDVDRMEQDGAVVAPQGEGRERSFVRCGPILPGHELQVRDETGEPLGERQVGRIFVRGPSLMREYFEQPEATAAALSADGWLDTGDLGFVVEGEVVPTGRAKDLILLNGRNVWPQDLEWTAEQAVGALRSGDVAAVSVTDEAGEERVVVLVQCRSSDPDVRRTITEDVTAVLRARHGVDAQVQLVGAHALPQTSSGKLSRSKARALFESGAFEKTAR